VFEYFVYYRWRLLPAGDVRRYIRPQLLSQVAIEDVSTRKRAALECFVSQTTRFYAWQSRPCLGQKLLDERSREPEFLMRTDPSLSGTAVFERLVTWIRCVHRWEPLAKRVKDQVVALCRRGFHRDDKTTR
jgi:hypothetical protein